MKPNKLIEKMLKPTIERLLRNAYKVYEADTEEDKRKTFEDFCLKIKEELSDE